MDLIQKCVICFDNNTKLDATHTCAKAECKLKRIVLSKACCKMAELKECLCFYKFVCEQHGTIHIGNHE